MSHSTIIMRSAILVFAIVFWAAVGSKAATLSVAEKSHVGTLGKWNLEILLHLLGNEFPLLDSHDGMVSLTLFHAQVVEPVVSAGSQPVFLPEQNTIRFEFPKGQPAVQLKLKFFWVVTYLVVPISGTAEVSVTGSDVVYEVRYQGNEVVPKLPSMTWTIHNVTISGNPFAGLFGIPNTLQSMLQRQWNIKVPALFEQKLLPALKRYFAIKYPETHDLLFTSPFTSNSMSFPQKLASFVVHSDFLQYDYSERNQLLDQETNVDSGYAIRYLVGDSILTTALQNGFGILYPAHFEVTPEIVPAESGFQLTGAQFAQVVPDFYMVEGDQNVTMKIDSLGQALRFQRVSSSRIRLEGYAFNVTFDYKGARLVSATIKINATFSPVVEITKGERSGALKVKMVESAAEVGQVEVGEKYKSIVKGGLRKYIQNGLDEWIMKTYPTAALGNGIYVEFDHELDTEKSYADVTEEGLQAWLYSVD